MTQQIQCHIYNKVHVRRTQYYFSFNKRTKSWHAAAVVGARLCGSTWCTALGTVEVAASSVSSGVGIRRKGMTDTHNEIMLFIQKSGGGGSTFPGRTTCRPFQGRPHRLVSRRRDRSTPTHGYRRSFPQTVGRWHSDRSGLVSSARVP